MVAEGEICLDVRLHYEYNDAPGAIGAIDHDDVTFLVVNLGGVGSSGGASLRAGRSGERPCWPRSGLRGRGRPFPRWTWRGRLLRPRRWRWRRRACIPWPLTYPNTPHPQPDLHRPSITTEGEMVGGASSAQWTTSQRPTRHGGRAMNTYGTSSWQPSTCPPMRRKHGTPRPVPAAYQHGPPDRRRPPSPSGEAPNNPAHSPPHTHVSY